MLALTGMTACGNTKTGQNLESKEVAQTEKKKKRQKKLKMKIKKPGQSQTTQVTR